MDDVRALTSHAIENKITNIKIHGIEMTFHPAAFIVPSSGEVKPPKKLTSEEKLQAEKEKLEADLFYSVT